MADLPRLFVATASGREPKWPYPQCLAEMIAMSRGFDGTMFKTELHYATDQARCQLAKEAVKKKFTHILFLDDDMSFPWDTADRLVAHERPIVAANYTSRVYPPMPLAWKDGDRLWSRGRAGLERVDFAPTGVMMIETRVFASLEMPWFKTEYDAATGTWSSDDIYFCRKARAAGFDTWVDHDLSQQIGHVGPHAFNHTMLLEPESDDVLELARGLLAR